MKRLKYLYSVIALMLAMSFTASAAYTEEFQLSSALGILPYEKYSEETNVTRAEFAYIAARTAGLESERHTYTGEIFFKDIPADHEYAQYINALARLDLIRGYSDGYFEPDYNVTVLDAAYTLVKVLGYKNQAEMSGGYPDGYVKIANELGLFKGAGSGQYLTQAQMCKVLYNALTSKRSIMSISGNDVSYTDDEIKTLLYDVFDVTEVKGIITTNGTTSLDNSKSIADTVIINGERYFADDSVEEMLGYYVTAYVKWEDREGTIIAAFSKDTSTVRVADEDIEDGSTIRNITTYVDGKKKDYKISAEVEFIYNGTIAQNLQESDVFIKSGYLDLIDTDDNGEYDIINITKYESCFVYGFSELNEKIIDKYGNNLQLSNKNYKIYINGEQATIADLEKYDCINYTRTKDDDNYVIHVTRGEMISGAITGINSDGDLMIDGGSEYAISESYKNLVTERKTEALAMGMQATFYIDILGRIMAYEPISNADRTELYGYLIRITGDYEIEGMYAKILTTEGNIETIPVARNIKVDGDMYKDNDTFVSLLSTDGYISQPVRYGFNADEEISKLDTPIMGTNETEGIDLTAAKVPVHDGGDWSNGSTIFGGRFYLDKTTITFQVPGAPASSTATDYRGDNSMYSVKLGQHFGSGEKSGDFEAYDLTPDYTARLIVHISNSASSVTYKSSTAMVDSFKTVYDESEGETVGVIVTAGGSELKLTNNITYYEPTSATNGKLVSQGKKTSAQVIAELEKGDIIQYNLDSKKNVDALAKLYDVSETDIPTRSYGNMNTSSYYTYHGLSRYGTYVVLEANGNSFMAAELPSSTDSDYIYEVTIDGVTYQVKQYKNRADRAALFVYRYSGTVYVYDKATDKITTSDITELNDILYKDNSDARVFIRQGYGTVKSMFVIK